MSNGQQSKRNKLIAFYATDEEHALWHSTFANLSKTIRLLLNAAAAQRLKKGK